MEKDMTVGNPTKMILDFTVPLFIGNVFQQLYNMADTIIVGKFVGANALAAVGSTGTIMFLIIGFLQGMTAGFTVPTAQKFGAGDMKSVRKTVGSAAILSFIVSAIMTVISMVIVYRITRHQLLHVGEEILILVSDHDIGIAGVSATAIYIN